VRLCSLSTSPARQSTRERPRAPQRRRRPTEHEANVPQARRSTNRATDRCCEVLRRARTRIVQRQRAALGATVVELGSGELENSGLTGLPVAPPTAKRRDCVLVLDRAHSSPARSLSPRSAATHARSPTPKMRPGRSRSPSFRARPGLRRACSGRRARPRAARRAARTSCRQRVDNPLRTRITSAATPGHRNGVRRTSTLRIQTVPAPSSARLSRMRSGLCPALR